MRLVLLIGNQPRHYHIARQLRPFLLGAVIEEREPFIPDPPAGLDDRLAALWRYHFAAREASESRFFGRDEWDFDVPTLRVSRRELNGEKTRGFVSALLPNLVLSYGVHILDDATLASFPAAWNIHGGLSPRYRGVATLFWPSYMLEPQMTGMTVHQTTSEVDAGPIVHQVCAPLIRGDGIHDLTCRAVAAIASDLPRLITGFAQGSLNPPARQSAAGRLWTVSDWRPEHLRVIYEFWNDRIVDAYLDGNLLQNDPELVRQL